jgi:hypothetical protein
MLLSDESFFQAPTIVPLMEGGAHFDDGSHQTGGAQVRFLRIV